MWQVAPHLAQSAGRVLTHITCWHSDHVVEIQVVGKTLQKSGVCDALDAILKAAGSGLATKKAIVKAVVDKINTPANLLFLNAKLNGKASFIILPCNTDVLILQQ